MKQRFNAFAVREERGRKYWTRLGVIFVNDKGITAYLDAMPASTDGQYKIVGFLPKDEAETDDAYAPDAE